MMDIVIVGGGVIGLSIAYELAGQGVSVRVLEQAAFGREASWAGAGMLPPGNPQCARSPKAMLRAESHVLWSKLSEQLLSQTGVDNGYRNCGAIGIHFEAEDGDGDGEIDRFSDEIDFWLDEEVEVELLDPAQLKQYEPELSQEIYAAYRIPASSQVRNPRHLKALLAGCAIRNVDLVAGSPVIGFDLQDGKVVSARTAIEVHQAGQFCVAGGAWTQTLLQPFVPEIVIEPVRGQIVLLAAKMGLLRHVIEDGSRYLVPRPDGRVLVGSTEEYVGFDRRTTADGVAELIRFAVDRVPALASAEVERSWAGLRPGSIDGLPYLDRVPDTENMFVAAGHFRSGLQNSPFTAVLMSQLMLGEKPSLPLDAFACHRHRGQLTRSRTVDFPPLADRTV